MTGDLPPHLRDRDAWTGGFYELAMIGWEASGFVRAETSVREPEDRPYALVLTDGTYLPAAS